MSNNVNFFGAMLASNVFPDIIDLDDTEIVGGNENRPNGLNGYAYVID